MKQVHAFDLGAFISEMANESDRGLALVAAAQIDELLGGVLKSFFCEGPDAEEKLLEGDKPLSSFSARTETCYALGLIDEHEYREITLVRKVRNEFAHKRYGLTFMEERVRGFCSTFRSSLPEGPVAKDPRFRFTNAVAQLTSGLIQRDVAVAEERRKRSDWGPTREGEWEAFEPVPIGEEQQSDMIVSGRPFRRRKK